MKNKFALFVFAIGLGASFSATALNTNSCWSALQGCLARTHDTDKCFDAYEICCRKATGAQRCAL